MDEIKQNPNGRVLPFSEVVKRREELVPIISEGCTSLANALNGCIDNNVPTIACCAGHSRFDNAYLTMAYTKDTKELVNGIIDYVQSVSGIEIMLSSTGMTNNPVSVTFYIPPKCRDTAFSLMAKSLKEQHRLDVIPDKFISCVRFILNQDLLGQYSTVSIYNRKILPGFRFGVSERFGYEDIFKKYQTGMTAKGAYDRMVYRLYHSTKEVTLLENSLNKIYKKRAKYTSRPLGSDIDTMLDSIASINGDLNEEKGSIRHRF